MIYRRILASAASTLACLGVGATCWAQAEAMPGTEIGIAGVEAEEAGDPARAADLYRQACGMDDAAACALLGSKYTREGRGVEPDMNRALEYFQRGCDLGNAVACDAVRQVEAHRASAEAEVEAESTAAAITAAEAAAEDAAEPEVDPSAPAPITFDDMRQGCDDGVAIDCLTLGHMYRDGNGAPQDGNRAVAMYRTACDISKSDDQFGSYACHFAAAAYESGEGVPQDLARALLLYQKSCKAGNDDSCEQARVVQLATEK
ncbi:tetratricopeptide repeat protein [Sphingopyxis sp. Root154]|jgi:TPR repeat protein|nr:tetratricopeptide repeat protein [Sphingopyxis sp. Root154]